MSDARWRVTEMEQVLSAFPDVVELRRHAIVSSIAALQTFHRGMLVVIMEADPTMRLRASELLDDKFTLRETLDYLGGGRLSAEELIAHSASANNVNDLITWLGHLFDADFKVTLSKAVNRYSRDDPNAEPIVTDVPALLASLDEAFRLRHVFAHEAAPRLQVAQDQAQKLVSAIASWMEAVDGTLWMTVFRDAPLTQFEMNMGASTEVQYGRNRLAVVMQRLRKRLNRRQRQGLSKNHKEWMATARDLAKLAYGSKSGTMWPAVHGNALAKMFTQRADVLEGWATFEELE